MSDHGGEGSIDVVTNKLDGPFPQVQTSMQSSPPPSVFAGPLMNFRTRPTSPKSNAIELDRETIDPVGYLVFIDY